MNQAQVDKCKICDKTAYLTEKLVADNETYHKVEISVYLWCYG